MARYCLDAGHGGKDPGAVGYSRQEKDDALKLTLAVGKILKKRGHTVNYTRKTDIYESPSKKASDANAYGADLFISFHRNSADKTASGHETLVYKNSGIPKKFAEYANKKMAEIGFKNRGTKVRTNVAVLKRTTMPAVLTETGFITNKSDNALFDAKFSEIAEVFADAAEKALGIKNESSGSVTDDKNTDSEDESFMIIVSGVEKGDVLNIREKPDADSKKTGSLKYNDPNKYTIIQTKQNGSTTWGKLKSGIGWINLKYTKTV